MSFLSVTGMCLHVAGGFSSVHPSGSDEPDAPGGWKSHSRTVASPALSRSGKEGAPKRVRPSGCHKPRAGETQRTHPVAKTSPPPLCWTGENLQTNTSPVCSPPKILAFPLPFPFAFATLSFPVFFPLASTAPSSTADAGSDRSPSSESDTVRIVFV